MKEASFKAHREAKNRNDSSLCVGAGSFEDANVEANDDIDVDSGSPGTTVVEVEAGAAFLVVFVR